MTAAPIVYAQAPAAGDAKAILLNETVVRQMIKYKIDPEYPATARQFHIFGDVVVQVTIGADGKVESVDEARGNQLLQGSVKSALRKWVFSPYLADGKAARVRTSMTFSFKL
jgi:TonB family protein